MSKLEHVLQDADQSLSKLHAAGFHTRPATFGDLPNAVKMINAAERDLHGNESFTEERYEQEWRIPGLTLETDTRIVLAPNNDLVGLVEVWDIHSPPVHPWIWARVDPAYQNQGIGTALMEWAFNRARATEARLESGVRFAPRAGTIVGHQASTTLLESMGMIPIRYGWSMRIEMDSPPPPPVWPQAIQLQKYQHPQQAEAVYRTQDEAFQDHWGYVAGDFDKAFARWQHVFFNLHELDTDLWFLAMAGEEIAGIAICFLHADEDPNLGWVEILAVRKPWRRQGLGLALLQQSFGAYYERGMRKVGLGVDSQNLSGATRLYEKAGMHVSREQVTYEIELRSGVELEKRD